MRNTGWITVLLLAALTSPAFAVWSHENDTLYTYYTPGRSMDLIEDGSGGLIAGLWVQQQTSLNLRMFRIGADGTGYPDWDSFIGVRLQFTPDGTGGVFKGRFVSFENAEHSTVSLWHVSGAGGLDAAWPADPVVLEFEPGGIAGGIAADDSGGVYVGCNPPPTIEGDPLGTLLYRFLPDRTPAPGWPIDGFVVRNSFVESYVPELPPVLIRDGEGGVVIGFVAYASSGPSAPFSIRLQRVGRDGVRKWTAGGRLVTTTHATVGPILGLMVAGDHVYCLWADDVSAASRHIRLQRIKLLDGTPATGWPANGILIATGDPGSIDARVLADDGSGAFVAWSGGSPMGIRITSAGMPVPGWGTGISLVDAAAVVTCGWTVAPSPSGPLVGWGDGRHAGESRLRVRWLLPDGSSNPAQPDTGRVVGTSLNACALGIISDGAGGAYVGWSDLTQIGSFVPYILSWVPASGPVAAPPPAPEALAFRVWPNPARGTLTVRFHLADADPALAELIDVGGHRVRALRVPGAGERTARFDDLDALPAGVYFVRIAHAGRNLVTRVALIR